MGEYSGRTVVITGAGSGLGAAMAALFGAAGARVALLDIDGERAEAEAETLRERGIEAMACRVDVADKSSLAAAAEAVRTAHGAVHVLCANVGVQQFGAIDTLTDDDWTWVMSVNFHGVVATVNAFLPLLRAGEGERHVVVTSSASFFQLGIRMAAYVASKFAVTGYAEVLRDELEDEGINVAILYPAGMTTRHIESSIAARPADLGPSRFDPSDIRAMVARAGITMDGHLASAEEAVRDLLPQLRGKHRHIFTHGNYRDQIADRQAEVLDAFDRMAALRR